MNSLLSKALALSLGDSSSPQILSLKTDSQGLFAFSRNSVRSQRARSSVMRALA